MTQERLECAVTSPYFNCEYLLQLIANGACVNGKDNDGAPLSKAISRKKNAAFRLLLKQGADPNLKYSLHLAAANRDATYAISLIAAGSNPEALNEKGVTAKKVATSLFNGSTAMAIAYPLHAATARSMAEECFQLLERGYSPHQKNDQGDTPLDCAVRTSDSDCARILISRIAREEALAALDLIKRPGVSP